MCWTLAILLSGIVLTGIFAGHEIACPARRSLQQYHRDFLSQPVSYGMHLETFTLDDGTPCLLCEPDGPPGRRARILRDQLTENAIPLPDEGCVRANVVLCHGRSGRKEDLLPIAERFCGIGFRCIIPDMPGHGDHPISTTTYGLTEARLPAAALQKCAKLRGFPEKTPCALLGISMGGSVAVHAATQTEAPWDTLVVISSFDRLDTVVRAQAARRFGTLTARALLPITSLTYRLMTCTSLSSIRPIDCYSNCRIPTLILHGTEDTVIPISSGKADFEALPDDVPSGFVEIPNADHGNALVTKHLTYAAIATWLLAHAR